MNPPPPAPGPSWGTVLGTWQPTWVADALLLAAAVLYVVGAVRAGWPVRRTLAFLAAVAVTVVTLDSGISGFAQQAFAVHMVMHLSLIMVVPALAVAGRPLDLLRSHLTGGAAHRFDRILAGRVVRVLTFPATVLAVYALVVVLTHLTAFPRAVATSPALHTVEQLLYLGAGWLFFHTAIGVDAHPRRPAYFGRFVLMLVSMGVDTLVGIILMMAPADLLPVFALADVHLGGAIMWAVGDGLMMVIMVALSWSWVTDPSAQVDFGPWLESARRSAFAEQVGDDDVRPDRDDHHDLDDDDEALAAYNRMLARLNRGEQGHR